MDEQLKRGYIRAIAEDAAELQAATAAASTAATGLEDKVLGYVEDAVSAEAAEGIRSRGRGISEAERDRIGHVGSTAAAAVESHDYAAFDAAVEALVNPPEPKPKRESKPKK